MEPLTLVFILLAVSIVLIVLEIFIPSGGVLGGGSALFLLATVVTSFFVSSMFGWVFLAATTVTVPILMWGFFRFWPYTKMGSNFVMRPTERDVVIDEQRVGMERLIGKQGSANSEMLPSGSVMIDRDLHSAISEGLPIEIGTPIEVVAVRMHTLVVRPLQGEWREEDGRVIPANGSQGASEVDDELSQPIDSLGLDDLDQLLDESRND